LLRFHWPPMMRTSCGGTRPPAPPARFKAAPGCRRAPAAPSPGAR
jgi:hypothetical protein